MATKTFDNIEEIIRTLLSETELTNVNKYNGISFTLPKITKTKITEVLKPYKLLPVSTSTAKYDESLTIVELPEFEPYYTEEQNLKVYTDSINFLIEQALRYAELSGTTITKTLLLNDSDSYIVESIKMYYKSFVNTYKAKLEDFTQNSEYRKNIKNLFTSIVNQYPIKTI